MTLQIWPFLEYLIPTYNITVLILHWNFKKIEPQYDSTIIRKCLTLMDHPVQTYSIQQDVANRSACMLFYQVYFVSKWQTLENKHTDRRIISLHGCT